MKLKHVLAALAVASTLQAGGALAACDEGEKVVRFSHVVAADGHPKGEAAAYLAERVNAELDGALCMEVHPDSSLYEDDEALEALRAGNLELAAPSTARFDAYTSRLRLFDLPFLFRDEARLQKFAAGEIGREILGSLEESGLVGLDYWLAGFKQFSADRPLLVPSDAAGLTFRIQDAVLSRAMIESLGATPKVIPLGKVRAALEAGEVNGQENSWSNIFTQGLHEVQNGITETNHQAFVYVLVTSRAFLDGLAPDVRDRFLELVEDATRHANERFGEFETGNRDAILASGVEIRQLSSEQRSEWIKAMRPVWDRFAEEIGRQAIARAEAESE